MVENNDRTYESVHEELMQTGRFVELVGPQGVWPVQAYGKLVSGEEISFSARGCYASLRITKPGAEQPARQFKQEFEWPQASYLKPEQCLKLMLGWLSQYTS